MLEVKKERLQEVRFQLKKHLTRQYNCAAANMLKAERDKLKTEIKEMESRRAYKLASRNDGIRNNLQESKKILECNQIKFNL